MKIGAYHRSIANSYYFYRVTSVVIEALSPVPCTHGEAIIIGDGGANVLNGGAGDDQLDGAGGNNTLFGGAGNDLLLGGDQSDELHGGFDADVLVGGAGDDLLIGGYGGDTYYWNPGDGNDVVQDLGGGGTDKLYINLTDTGINPDTATFTRDANDMVISIPAGSNSAASIIRVAGMGDTHGYIEEVHITGGDRDGDGHDDGDAQWLLEAMLWAHRAHAPGAVA